MAEESTTRGTATTSESSDTPAGTPERSRADADRSPPDDLGDPATLAARLDALAGENRRLRREYARARRQQYRRTAAGLALVGLLAVAAAVLVPTQRTVLLALGGTGAFGAVLTWTLTPERFVAAAVGERIHRAHASNQAALRTELGLQDDRIYVPADAEPARLFVPQQDSFEVPAALDTLLVVPEDPDGRGIALAPTGGPLYEWFAASIAGEPATDPADLAAQLADAAVEDLELAAAASVAVDREGDGVAVRVEDPVFGDLDATDHPVPSFLATGLAATVDRPVSVTVARTDDADAVLEFRFLET